MLAVVPGSPHRLGADLIALTAQTAAVVVCAMAQMTEVALAMQHGAGGQVGFGRDQVDDPGINWILILMGLSPIDLELESLVMH